MTPIIFLTLCSCSVAVAAAIFAWLAVRRGSVVRLSKRFDQLQLHLGELAGAMEHQEAALMNLRSRITMQATRAKRSESPNVSPGSVESSTDSEKADARRRLGAALANGSIKPPGR